MVSHNFRNWKRMVLGLHVQLLVIPDGPWWCHSTLASKEEYFGTVLCFLRIEHDKIPYPMPSSGTFILEFIEQPELSMLH